MGFSNCMLTTVHVLLQTKLFWLQLLFLSVQVNFKPSVNNYFSLFCDDKKEIHHREDAGCIFFIHSVLPHLMQYNFSITFPFSLFDVCEIKAACENENIHRYCVKDLKSLLCSYYKSDTDHWCIACPLCTIMVHFSPLMCISLNLHEPSILYPMTFTLTTPLLISREHSGGKAFHLLNKVEGCHNTGA